MRIDTIDFDPEALTSKKEIEVQGKELDTPAKALQVGKLRSSEKVSPLARGVVEIYREANAVALENSRDGWKGLATRLQRQAESANDDEVIIPFIKYDDTADIEPENAKEIAKLQTNSGDILTVPLMSPLVDGADDGDDRTEPEVASIIQNTEIYLEAVGELEITKPVMGVVPAISEDCTQALVDLYMENGLRAYCIDLNRRSPMAQSQIDNVINPLIGALTQYDLREDSFVYAVNPNNNSRKTAGGRRTPDSMYSYTLGLDIVGDNHISPDIPQEVLEDMVGEGEVELRLFDSESVSIVEVPVSELKSFLPNEAEVPIERVQERVNVDQSEQYRFEKIINTELISIYLDSEEGVAPDEILDDLITGPFSQDSDIERVEDLLAEIRDRE